MISTIEPVYSQCLDELKVTGIHARSLGEYAEKVVQIVKERINFLFVGIALLEPNLLVRFYKGAGSKYYQRRMNMNIKLSNPICIVIRNGSPLVDDNEEFFNNPDILDEKIRFYLPLQCPKGRFGAIEISAAYKLDKDSTARTVTNLEILSSEIASTCVKLMNESEIGFWKD
ncbi:MAG: hypothetical protein IPP66_11095 [Anaerolineales bacterium]|nr:hypothetical protein [Anaerolineales bacterium]